MVKKIIGSIIEGGTEFVKDSAKQVGETVSPVELVEQAIGQKATSNEFSDYIKSLGGNLSAGEIEKKRKEFEEKKIKEMEEARKVIHSAMPEHLRAKQKKELSVYEQRMQEEIRKAQQVEALKKQQQQKPLQVPAGQKKGILGGVKRRPKASDFEKGKNIKIG